MTSERVNLDQVDTPRPHPGRALLVYAAAIIVFGALGAPWLFWFVQWLAATVPACAGLGHYPFKRVFDRAFLIVALAGLWPLLRSLGLRSWRELGFPRTSRWWHDVVLGCALGLLSFIAVVTVSLNPGSWHVTRATDAGLILAGRPGGDDFLIELPNAHLLLKLLITAVVVAVIEEAFFRGGVQGTLQRSLPRLPALLLASVIYSALHFLKPSGVKIAALDVRWSSGFDCLAAILTRSYAVPGAAVAFVTLFLVGVVLGLAFQRTQALYWSMGLHAGWVFANEYVRAAIRTALVEDRWAWPVVIVVAGIVYLMTRGSGFQPRSGSDPVAVGNRAHEANSPPDSRS